MLPARALFRFLLLGLLLTLNFKAAAHPPPDSGGRLIGEIQYRAGGAVYSWVELTPSGEPGAIGVSLTGAVLEHLPHTLPNGQKTQEAVLRMPPGIPTAGFNHVGLNWNPAGHPPSGIYDVPHLDVHFYYLTPDERRQITLQGKNGVAAQPLPAASVPADYILPPGTVEPNMGAHWLDSKAPELSGQPFSRTLIFGSYAGKLAFIEPMVTLDFLRTRPEISAPVKQPARYAQPGYYPTRYRVRYDSQRQEYAISLERFVAHGIKR